MKKYSIKDIAELSGVSVATVSRVINNNGRFSEKTRKKVEKVIEETGYQPNFSAKSLRMNKSHSIGILVPDITNHFFAEVVQKTEEILFKSGYSTIICNTARDNKKEQVYLNTLESKGVDGLIIISGAKKFDYTSPINSEKVIPYICIDRAPADEKNTIFISSDHYQGAYLATLELIKSGSSSPVFLTHNRESTSQAERFQGFKAALEKHKIKFSEDKHTFSFDLNSETDKKKLVSYFENTPQIDGVFAVNDNLAIKVMNILKKMSISVPNNMKVIGFDDIPQCENISPSLSSVKQDTDKIASMTVDNLLRLIKSPKNAGNTIKIPVSLKLRESTQTN
jgi:LacI family transcriptional regulator